MRVFGVFLSLNGLLFILCEREKFYYFLLYHYPPYLSIRPKYEMTKKTASGLTARTGEGASCKA